MQKVRIIFDTVIDDYTQCKLGLGSFADITLHRHFETEIVIIQHGKASALLQDEERAVFNLKIQGSSSNNLSYEDSVVLILSNVVRANNRL